MAAQAAPIDQPDLKSVEDAFNSAKQKHSGFLHSFQALTEEAERKNEEIKRIEADIAKLTAKKTMMMKNHDQWKVDANVFDAVVVPYSKAWNLHFAGEMQAKLPQELRDMVYSFIWDLEEKEDFLYSLGFHINNPLRCGGCPSDACKAHVEDIPHYLIKEYMGTETATEIANFVYNMLSVGEYEVSAASPADIHVAVHKDMLHLGIDVANYVRTVHVDCTIEEYRTSRVCDCTFEQRESCKHGEAPKQHLQQAKLQSQFQHLLEVKKKDGFQLHIDLIQRNLRVGIVREFLETIRETVEAIRKAGGKVSIQWEYEYHSAAVIRRLEDYYDSDQQVWQNKMFDNMHEFLTDRLISQKHTKFLHEPRLILGEDGKWVDGPSKVASEDDSWHPRWDTLSYEDDVSDLEDDQYGDLQGYIEHVGMGPMYGGWDEDDDDDEDQEYDEFGWSF